MGVLVNMNNEISYKAVIKLKYVMKTYGFLLKYKSQNKIILPLFY